jgi:hypothetical protein
MLAGMDQDRVYALGTATHLGYQRSDLHEIGPGAYNANQA